MSRVVRFAKFIWTALGGGYASRIRYVVRALNLSLVVLSLLTVTICLSSFRRSVSVEPAGQTSRYYTNRGWVCREDRWLLTHVTQHDGSGVLVERGMEPRGATQVRVSKPIGWTPTPLRMTLDVGPDTCGLGPSSGIPLTRDTGYSLVWLSAQLATLPLIAVAWPTSRRWRRVG